MRPGWVGVGLMLLAVAGGTSCSRTRDGRLYRVYHNMHARYNGFFYATEAMDEADEKLREGYEENWDEVLPIFFTVDTATAKEVYPLLEKAIEKCSKVVDKHTMAPSARDKKEFKRPELNKWIDNNYDLIARAHLMKGQEEKAVEVFQYLARTLEYPEGQAWSNAWLARSYMAMDDQVRASNALGKAVGVDGVEDPEVSAFVYQVYAAYYLQYNDPERAVSRLEQALEYLPKKGAERARTLFILAQCLESLGRASEAIDRYQQVVALRTPYEMEFYAKIKQAMAFDRRGGNSAPIVLLLEEMLADDKNEIYQDQIYYALAVLALEERRRDDTFGLLKSSLAANSDNTRQRMKSYLMLGDLYMDELDYLNAQAYYDSARTFMDDDHERFDEVDALAESLSDLVANLKVIEEQDSLLALCDLGEDERRARIREIREQLEAEAEARRKALEAAIAAEADAAGDAGTGMFWPYNAQLRVSGRRNFKDYWGDRPLEDHWRRSNKLQIIFTEEAPVDSAATADSGEPAAVQSGGLASEEEMVASLPCGEAARDSSEAKIAQAYYQAGIVYKEQLDDPENAIESWKSLVYRFEESAVHPTAYYQLYRTYLQREVEENFSSPFCEDCNSEFWAARVVERYPDSEWAILVENPDYADKEEVRRQTERAAYEALLARYYAKAYVEVMRETERIIAAEPENYYLCKHRILRAQAFAGSISGTGADRGQYFQALNDVIKGCPDTEEATFAQELLDLLGAPREKEPEAVVVEETPDEELFVHKPYLEHYFAIVVPVGRGNVESVRAKVADFNTKFYRSESLRVTANLIDKNHQIILVKSFKRQDYSLDYYTTFTTNTAELAALNTSGYPMFVITSENYVNLFRSKKIDAYIEFFNAKYLTEGR